MPTLRLSQTSLSANRYRVELHVLRPGLPDRAGSSEFEFDLPPQDEEDLRWYLEDYLKYPIHPAPTIAERVERRMAELGEQLFKLIFLVDDDTRECWRDVRDHLNSTRIEIVTDVQGATAVPWELVRDPLSKKWLALSAESFVRATHRAVTEPIVRQEEEGPIRILLVICRPEEEQDVPFRSVAARLLRGLDETARETYQLDLCRPPTFEELRRRLQHAHDEQKPYHILHFDGHGAFLDLQPLSEEWKDGNEEENEEALKRKLDSDPRRFSASFKRIYPGTVRSGEHGYLLFDNPDSEYNYRFVDGPDLGALLRDTGVSVLVLNACRSAFAETPEAPAQVDAAKDVHSEIRAYGSLAQEIMDQGVAGVIAMRYNLWVVTAADYVAELYASLVRGQTLGQAATAARKQLHADPYRAVGYDPIPLQDWCVPVCFEAAPVKLFPQRAATPLLQQASSDGSLPGKALDPKLPKRPDIGFIGRDETLIKLDHTFDRYRIVLLHAYAGSGKTATAAEFARWYWQTGGTPVVVFSSFEHRKTLSGALNDFGQVLEPVLRQANWTAADESQKRQLALQLLKQIPVLWIWDNVEPVMGFPAGTESAWKPEEQEELKQFLQDAQETKVRILLTSRRDERAWLGDLPFRVAIPPMRLNDRVEMARALADKQDRRLDIADWLPLLRFTQGNPLTIQVVVSQAFRLGLDTSRKLKTYEQQLRAGKEDFVDDETEGRNRSLGASLSYGFDRAFTTPERSVLALLHLFQGFVDADVLSTMGDSRSKWSLQSVHNLQRASGIALLNRVAEIGLLIALSGGYYVIHPAVPWFLKTEFDTFYRSDAPDHSRTDAIRAYVEAMSNWANYYHDRYQEGDTRVLTILAAEEFNLLHAHRLARQNGWWNCVISTMRGLHSLYDYHGRRAEWKRLVEEIVPDFVDLRTDSFLPGREEAWRIVNDYRVDIAFRERRLIDAERLQRMRLQWASAEAQPALAIATGKLSQEQRDTIRNLASSYHMLGRIQHELASPMCLKAFEDSCALSERVGDELSAAKTAQEIGNVYVALDSLKDLGNAELWFTRSLKLKSEANVLGRARSLGSLGSVSLENFSALLQQGKAKEASEHLLKAAERFEEALRLFPVDALADRAVGHHQLGIVYSHLRNWNQALLNYSKSITFREQMADTYGAGQSRYNVAVALMSAGRYNDALSYAQAALYNFVAYGGRAETMAGKTRELIAHIEDRDLTMNK